MCVAVPRPEAFELGSDVEAHELRRFHQSRTPLPSRPAIRRVLLATDGGAERLPEPLFWGLIETIVRNLLVDRFRRNGVRRAVLRRLRDGAAGSDAHVPSPAVDPELRDAATRVLQALSADERALVQLRMQGQIGRAHV